MLHWAGLKTLCNFEVDSIAVSVFVVDIELTNPETAAATPPTVMQIFQRASDQ